MADLSNALRAVLDAQVSERDMQQAVMDACRLGGWNAYHVFDARRSPEGFPDVLAIRGGEMLVWELKTARGRTTPAQASWLRSWQVFGEAHGLGAYLEARVVRPCDMPEALARLLTQPGAARVEVL